MAIEMNIRILADTGREIMSELAQLSSRASTELGVAPATEQPPATEAAPAKANGADAAPTKRGRKSSAPEPEPETTKGPDRAGVIDGLTKIYGEGDPDVRKRITKFRDERGAARLRDLKDEDLPAAAQLLVDLKLAEPADAP